MPLEELQRLVDRADAEALLAVLPTLTAKEQWAAFDLLQRLGKRKGVPLLLKMLETPDPVLRRYLISTLGQVGGKRVFKSLVRFMQEDSDASVREQAAHALSFLFDPDAYEPLLAVLHNAREEPRVRAQAAEGLGYLLEYTDRRTRRFKRAVRALIAALRDEAPEVRFWSAFALGSMRARQALPELRRLAETDEAMCPHWWPVKDEASDAITVILGGQWPDRERRVGREQMATARRSSDERISRRELGRITAGAVAGALMATTNSGQADSASSQGAGKPAAPAPETDTRLALIEESHGKPLTEAQRKAVLENIKNNDGAWKKGRGEFSVPDGTEPDFTFRPAPLPGKGGKARG